MILEERLAELEQRHADLLVASTRLLETFERGDPIDGAVKTLRLRVFRGGRDSWGVDGCREAGQRWHEIYGAPPKVDDWNPGAAARLGRPEQAQRYYEGHWPHYNLVRYHFGGWTEFMVACGFEPRQGPERRNTIGSGDIDRLPPWNGWEFLSNFRRRKGLRQSDVSRLSGVSLGYVGEIEKGQMTNPTVRVILALSRALGMPPAAFFE